MKTDIFLIGPMGSGKTTIANELAKNGFDKTRAITTRPKRPNEPDDEYFFTDNEGFKSAVIWDDVRAIRVYSTKFGIWRYGISMKEFQQDRDTVTILDPSSFEYLAPDIGESVFGVFLDAPEDLCKLRALARGDDPKEVDRRIKSDREDFAELRNRDTNGINKDIYKCIIDRSIYNANKTPSMIANGIIRSIQMNGIKK